MVVAFVTCGSFLRSNFPRVRAFLLGNQKTSKKYQAQINVRSIAWSFGIWLLRFVLIAVILTACITIGALVLPDLASRLSTDSQQEVLSHARENISVQPSPVVTPPVVERPIDASLPKGVWIRIPKVGVDTQAFDLADSEEALAQGAWLVPDFGKPGDTTQPTIIAAHRYGWKSWWQSDYWRLHSFYLLTETKPGDVVEIISDQKKYVYEIYAGDEGEEITDYSADLILYTCKFLNSPQRYFRYAKLLPQG